MSVFVCAAEAGSLSAAARTLAMPLATVSRKVAELETLLKASLVIRSRAGLQLTEAGRSYLASARSILEEVATAERVASGEYSEPTGQLVVGSPVMFGRFHVLPVVTEFLAAYPKIDIRLVQNDRLSHLVDDHIDCALRIGELPDSSITAIRLGEVRRVICASPGYLKEKGTPKKPALLSQHDCLTADVFGLPERWGFGAKVEVTVHSRLIVNTVEAAIDAAVSGSGLARALSYQISDQVRRGDLRIVLADFEPSPWPIHLLYKPQSLLPRKLRAFLDFAAPRLRQRIQLASLN
jgi:DNA-binding transcriptional LysR family regulator